MGEHVTSGPKERWNNIRSLLRASLELVTAVARPAGI
jgi:hypothetical protein